MGKNRKSNSAGNGQSGSTDETPNDFPSEAYKEAYNTINENTSLTDNEIIYLLDNILKDNIVFDKINAKTGHIMFRENIPDGENNPYIAMDTEALRNMYQGNGGFGLDTLMESYYDIPEFQRGLVTGIILGNTKDNFKGGSYSEMFNRIAINSETFESPSDKKAGNIHHLMSHEFTHALDSAVNGHFGMATDDTSGFVDIVKTEKGSAYSEGYRNDESSLYTETLAEAVAVTKDAKKYGKDNAYIENPNDLSRQTEYTYTEWSVENPKLAEFADRIANCNTKSEAYEVFMDYGW